MPHTQQGSPPNRARRSPRAPARVKNQLPRPRLTRLVLKNWRNFTSLDVELRGRAFIVGPNASGKSNLLDAIRFLHDLVSVGGGFQSATAKRGGISKIRCLSARQDPLVGLLVEVGDDREPTQWTYDLEFSQDSHRVPTIRKERVLQGPREILNRPQPEDEDDPKRLTQTFLEQVNVNREFRGLVEFLSSIRYLHIVPQLVREPDRSVGRRNDPYGGDFLEQIATTNKKTQAGRLARIQRVLKVAVPQLSKVEVWKDPKGTPHLRGKYEHWRPQGAWQTEGEFSDGTLRLTGLLWAALDGEGPLLLEEPELSLHPEVVRFVPQIFARMQRRTGRQVVISTHSPDLLRDEGIGLDEVLLLRPGPEGTIVESASSLGQVATLLRHGVDLPEAVLPRTSPKGVDQLSLFGDR